MKEIKEKFNNPEQTPEQIRATMIEAKLENLHVDLTIEGEKGETLDLIIDKIVGDVAYMTYVTDDGELGELIPLEISRIKKITIKK